MTTVGFIGLGRMGKPMAANLQKKGFQLQVHDVRNEPVADLVALGATNGGSIKGAADGADVVITVLPGPPEVEAAVLGPDGTAEVARPGQIVMDMSTVKPETTDKMAGALAKAGVGFVDCPIGRLASHADKGESLFMVGASDKDFATVKPLLEAMGTTIYHCGGPGTGTRTKLINNFLAITACQMNAEALTLAKAFGLNLESTLDVIHGTTATNGQLKINYATKVLSDDTAPGFTVDLAHKDMSLIVEAANGVKVPMPIAAVAREALSLARSTPYHALDFSALLDHWCERTGQPKVRFADKDKQ